MADRNKVTTKRLKDATMITSNQPFHQEKFYKYIDPVTSEESEMSEYEW